MPKPVKKKASGQLPVPRKPKRPSDPNRAAQSILTEHMGRLANDADVTVTTVDEVRPATPAEAECFEAMYRAKMAALGKKGGQVSGAKRMEMPEKQRKAIAKKAAAARWKKR